ncbi:ParB/RepB/Spo0J family partition protein [bacterium]|nr:ParB/RepB/Spo0J family partition protein [bacterium]
MPKSKKSGLPKTISMRHDNHFVDLLSTRNQGPRIRMISIDKINPNPQQARSELGNLEELMNSIQKKGVIEPLLVRSKGNNYEIIAGERRYMASKNVGLKEVPCIELDVKDNEAMELALIENLQRKNLNVFEEADGLKIMNEVYGYNHEKISKNIGKARSTITEIINIANIPREIRELCQKFQITSRSTLIEIAKQKDIESMKSLISEITQRNLKREDTRDLSRKIKDKAKNKEKKYVYNYKPKDSDDYRLKIEFKDKDVKKEDIIKILEDVLNKLKKE